jgi:ubiquinone/menaquinone biosynthesis C-methylase UbiE/DNA-binding transcriptional ArsR family regulator
MKHSRSISIIDRLAALGEVVRLRILRLLEVEELAVGEVARVVQLPQSTVSRHLRILSEGGWVDRRSEGTATLYRFVLDDLTPESRKLWLTVREQMGAGSELEEDGRRLAAVLAERRTDSQAFFGRVAGEWDQVRNQLFGRGFTPVALLSFLRRDWVFADLGCGTGNASELLAPVAERVIAIDQSEAMLAAARARLRGAGNVDFVLADLAKLPIGNGSVDAAVSALVLHHLGEPENALRESARVVRADRGGGVVLVIDMVAHDRDEYRHTMGHRHLGFSKQAMGSLMAGAGLSMVSYQELPVDPEARGPGLFAALGRKD